MRKTFSQVNHLWDIINPFLGFTLNKIHERTLLSVCVCIYVCIYVCRVDLSTSLHKIPQSEAELQTAGRWVVGSTGYHNKAYNTLHYTNANTIEGYLCVCVSVFFS